MQGWKSVHGVQFYCFNSKEINLLPISTRRYARTRAKDLISFEQNLKIW